jgi:hypothetical protein
MRRFRWFLPVLGCAVIVSAGCGDSAKVAAHRENEFPKPRLSRDPLSGADAPADWTSLPRAVIQSPLNGESVSAAWFEVTGALRAWSPGGEMFLFAKDEFGWYLQWPPVQLDRARKTFMQKNVRLGSIGEWELHLIAANPSASHQFHLQASRGDWSGLPSLPSGAVSIDSIVVNKLRE